MDKDLRLQFLKTTTALITAAFGMVAALAWNDAIKLMISKFLDSGNGDLIAMIIYAVIVTFIAVVVTVYIARLSARAEKESDEEEDTLENKKEQWKSEWEEEKLKEAYIKQLEAEN